MTKTAKQVVEVVEKKKNLKSSRVNVFGLTHTYDVEPRIVYVEAPYSVETFEVICAYIQYECAEIEQSFSMDQEDVIKVLEQFYECKAIKKQINAHYGVDLYENWEIYCGLADRVQSVKLLKRNGLTELLNKFVEGFYQAKPEWRPIQEEDK
ncbi:hypothetical protein J2W98_003775 [Paenibacillus peoriae]|uniref:Uncharacterized protein n=1 Tax=Paenibacillus peoriae TaxID=59893 RepID=A0ABU1QKZ3_9BACL|nr:hypothetical protein [Paenibacillus peoriae]MDR6779495.1 hypothetical protein [Paenibacillus peoriae]